MIKNNLKIQNYILIKIIIIMKYKIKIKKYSYKNYKKIMII